MSKALAKLPASQVALVAAMEIAAVAIRNASGDVPFLRLLKDGTWVIGADDSEVEAKSLWACDPASFCMGFQAWGSDADLLGEVTQLVTEQPVLRSELKDVDGEWKPLMGCTLLCISGEDEGLTVAYKTTSKGGIKALGVLMAELVARIKSNPADGTYIPVLELSTDHYKHKTYGRIYTPVLKIEEWTDEDELLAGGVDDDTPEEEVVEVEEVAEEKPKRRSRAKKPDVKEEPEELEGELVEEEAEKPTRRRRTRK